MFTNDYGNAYEARVIIVFFFVTNCLSPSQARVVDCLLFICSRSNSDQVSKCDDKLPKVNWSQHANAHDNFLSQNKSLCSNFLFSLSSQKPGAEGAMGARYVVTKHIVLFLFGSAGYNLSSIENEFLSIDYILTQCRILLWESEMCIY